MTRQINRVRRGLLNVTKNNLFDERRVETRLLERRTRGVHRHVGGAHALERAAKSAEAMGAARNVDSLRGLVAACLQLAAPAAPGQVTDNLPQASVA